MGIDPIRIYVRRVVDFGTGLETNRGLGRRFFGNVFPSPPGAPRHVRNRLGPLRELRCTICDAQTWNALNALIDASDLGGSFGALARLLLCAFYT